MLLSLSLLIWFRGKFWYVLATLAPPLPVLTMGLLDTVAWRFTGIDNVLCCVSNELVCWRERLLWRASPCRKTCPLLSDGIWVLLGDEFDDVIDRCCDDLVKCDAGLLDERRRRKQQAVRRIFSLVSNFEINILKRFQSFKNT